MKQRSLAISSVSKTPGTCAPHVASRPLQQAVLCLITGIALMTVASAEIRMLTGDANNEAHNQDSFLQDISADGDLVLFGSGSPASGSTPGITVGGLYRRKLSGNELTFVGDSSIPNGTVYASFSNNGRYLTWSTSTHQVYWRDFQTNTTRHITVGADGNSARPHMSGDGRYVAYASFARNLAADASKLPAANRAAILLYDSQTQTTSVASLASTGAALDTGVGAASAATAAIHEFDLSGNGRYLVFSSDATNAHPGRTASYPAGFLCIYRRDLQTGEVLLLNRNSSGAVADGNYSSPRISADGGRALFSGSFVSVFGGVRMTTAAPVAFGSDLFAKDIGSGEVWWVSRTTDNASAQNGAFGSLFAISGNGNVVSFSSTATNLVAEDTDAGGGHTGTFDIFRTNLGNSGATTTTLISKSPNGAGNVDFRSGPFLPGTGNYVAFCTSQLEAMFGNGNNASIFFQGIAVGTLPTATPAALTFSAWAMQLPAGERGYGDNFAGDGVTNLEKYFLGMNPLAYDLSQVPATGRAVGTALGLAGDSREYLTLRFRVRRALPAGFSWQVNASPDLTTLVAAPDAAIQVGPPVADGEFDQYVFRYPGPMTGKGFMRVVFSGP